MIARRATAAWVVNFSHSITRVMWTSPGGPPNFTPFNFYPQPRYPVSAFQPFLPPFMSLREQDSDIGLKDVVEALEGLRHIQPYRPARAPTMLPLTEPSPKNVTVLFDATLQLPLAMEALVITPLLLPPPQRSNLPLSEARLSCLVPGCYRTYRYTFLGFSLISTLSDQRCLFR